MAVEGCGLAFIVKRNARREDERTWIEQFHSELKTDMDVERLPSGCFKTNELVLSLSTLAFNALRRIGQTALASGARIGTGRQKRLRLRTVILNLMYVAAIVGSHGGMRRLRLGRNCHMAKTFIEVSRRLAA